MKPNAPRELVEKPPRPWYPLLPVAQKKPAGR